VHAYSLLSLLIVGLQSLPATITAAASKSITNSLTRNQQLNRVNLLLAPPPHQQRQRQQQQQQQQQRRNAATTTMMLKVCHKGIAEFATVPQNAGANAIFKLFTARPQLLEKRLNRLLLLLPHNNKSVDTCKSRIDAWKKINDCCRYVAAHGSLPWAWASLFGSHNVVVPSV
jgi:hypothetical protein